jgi:hypothetical protein
MFYVVVVIIVVCIPVFSLTAWMVLVRRRRAADAALHDLYSLFLARVEREAAQRLAHASDDEDWLADLRARARTAAEHADGLPRNWMQRWADRRADRRLARELRRWSRTDSLPPAPRVRPHPEDERSSVDERIVHLSTILRLMSESDGRASKPGARVRTFPTQQLVMAAGTIITVVGSINAAAWSGGSAVILMILVLVPCALAILAVLIMNNWQDGPSLPGVYAELLRMRDARRDHDSFPGP